MAIIMIVYGCQQGWGQSWSGIATYWYLLSPPPAGLGWNNTTFSLVLMLANIPWQIKALYGMVRVVFAHHAQLPPGGSPGLAGVSTHAQPGCPIRGAPPAFPSPSFTIVLPSRIPASFFTGR